MGANFGDYDNNGWIDLVKGNFSDDTKNLYHNNHDGTFTDVTYEAGIGGVGWLFCTLGAKFLDYDNDGWKDILWRTDKCSRRSIATEQASPAPSAVYCLTIAA
jgi:hypothetical protein